MHWRKIFSNKSDSTDIVMRKIENRRLNYMYNMPRLTWAYGKEKIRGAERNLPDFFGLCPRCQKNFPEKLSKIVFDMGGGNGYEKFL